MNRSLGSVLFFALWACGVGFEVQAGNYGYAFLEFFMSPIGAIHGIGHFAGFWL